MKCASFNVLADAYTGYGNYSNVDPILLQPGARTTGIIRVINELDVDIIGLQEVEPALLEAIQRDGDWQTFWSQKQAGKPDGCLMLVKPEIGVQDFETHVYSDESGHVAQSIRIGHTIFANTHIKWAPADTVEHVGVRQAADLVAQFDRRQPMVLFADCNDKPGGPVRRVLERAGFNNLYNRKPTAIVNSELVSLDIIAVRGLTVQNRQTHYEPRYIPKYSCPSDHVPLVADIG